MNAALVIVKKLKQQLKKLERQIAIGIRNARKYILQLIDCEVRLASIQIPPVSAPVQGFSESQIKEAFIKAGCMRYWKPEMIELIPQLIGLKIRASDPWDWMSKFAPVQKMDELGWSDRAIGYCIGASKILVGENPY